MAFSQKYPNTVMLIGFIEDAIDLRKSQSSGDKCGARLHNPGKQAKDRVGTRNNFDLNVSLIGFGKIAKLMNDYSLQGDLVCIVGRLTSLKISGRLVAGVYVEEIKTLDDGEDADVY
tara:strand:- start:1556 stop:1906 length:351 start_codon:yes stop_codon:yes gene_type:complete